MHPQIKIAAHSRAEFIRIEADLQALLDRYDILIVGGIYVEQNKQGGFYETFPDRTPESKIQKVSLKKPEQGQDIIYPTALVLRASPNRLSLFNQGNHYQFNFHNHERRVPDTFFFDIEASEEKKAVMNWYNGPLLRLATPEKLEVQIAKIPYTFEPRNTR
tara:strand:+ start:6109 stop:6591 length:483 start_codon:yes stop_codon:yes gene_type:complete